MLAPDKPCEFDRAATFNRLSNLLPSLASTLGMLFKLYMVFLILPNLSVDK